jgi:hypothetical protein
MRVDPSRDAQTNTRVTGSTRAAPVNRRSQSVPMTPSPHRGDIADIGHDGIRLAACESEDRRGHTPTRNRKNSHAVRRIAHEGRRIVGEHSGEQWHIARRVGHGLRQLADCLLALVMLYRLHIPKGCGAEVSSARCGRWPLSRLARSPNRQRLDQVRAIASALKKPRLTNSPMPSRPSFARLKAPARSRSDRSPPSSGRAAPYRADNPDQ